MFPNHTLDVNGFEAIDVNMRIKMLHELSVVIFYIIIFYNKFVFMDKFVFMELDYHI